MALRLVEHGVRMVQVFYGDSQPWDSHDDIMDHGRLARRADGPIASLVDWDWRAEGVKGGLAYGATDDFGLKATENPVHPNDLHATVLHLLGLDHKRLTYRHSGRDFRLTDVGGKVLRDILA